MQENKLCISVPLELQCYQKILNIACEEEKLPNQIINFGIKVIKDESGAISHVEYYSDKGILAKKIFYDKSCISEIKYYRNESLYLIEEFHENKIVRKKLYDKKGVPTASFSYKYLNNDKILSIEKSCNNSVYVVIYGYDDLSRVNSRKILVNNVLINEQKYKYDILDRLSDYQDKNQSVHVNEINFNNELINYVIIDKMRNEIVVNNHFFENEYVNTDITLNGHTITVKDRSYTENIMLNKPYTTENDLDFTICNMLKSDTVETKRKITDDISDNVISESIKRKILPISIRKLALLNNYA